MMNALYITISLVIFCWVLFKYYKMRKNELYTLELQSIYDKMEINFIANENNKMLNEEIDFLKTYKRIAQNSKLLDIRCIIMALGEQKKQNNSDKDKHIDNIVKRQNKEFRLLLDQFHRVAFRKVRMSLFNSGFIWVLIVVLFQSFITCNISFFKNKVGLNLAMRVLNPTGMGYVAPHPC